MSKKIDNDKMLDLYNQGLNDADIAGQLGCSRATITAWRKKNSLPPHRAHREKPEPVTMDCGVSQAVPEEPDLCEPPKPAAPAPIKAADATREQLLGSIKRLNRQILFLRGVAVGAGVSDIDSRLAEVK